MAKKGGSKHFVRLGAQKSLGVVDRKKVKWLLAPSPGTHGKRESVSIGVLLRDVLRMASNLHEVRRMLNAGAVLVDGKKVKSPKFPVGPMDIVSDVAGKKTYRMEFSGPNLAPKEVAGEAASRKYLKAVRKHTVKGGKTCITFHDGRNYLGDNGIRTGDTCVFSVPGFELGAHIKLAQGAQCIVMSGKHRGAMAKLEKIVERPGSHAAEAVLSGPEGEFITVVKYLFVIDGNYSQ